jgi:hypothetical protein
MPLSPISACVADLAMPGAVVLNDFIPAKRIPVYLSTFTACVLVDEQYQWNGFALARKLILNCQILRG